jgi:hypothetical protein
MPNQGSGQSLEDLVSEIRELHRSVEVLASDFRNVLREREKHETPSPSRYSGRYWSLAVVADSLVRVRLLIEQNLTYFETLGVLALTRYVFELAVWVRLVQKDNRYGLLYYRELVNKQRLHYQDLHRHLVAEAAFLSAMSDEEKKLVEQRLSELGSDPDPDAASKLYTETTKQIDATAARRFTLYGEEARTNGYGFQAHLVETQAMPKAKAMLGEVEQELRNVDAALSPQVRKLIPDLENWKRRATLVGMSEEYDFIYSYTSRLLHATPSSITTNQKNLEIREMEMFLRYVKVRIVDLVGIATTLLAETVRPGSPSQPVN